MPFCSFDSKCYRNCRRPAALGNGIYSFLTRRLLTASSRSSGLFVAPIIKILASSPAKVFAPSNCTKNSVLILLDVSFSPSLLLPHRESTSSMKIIAGLFYLASWKSCLTSLSDSPSHLLTKSEELMEKKVPSASVAQALAR